MQPIPASSPIFLFGGSRPWCSVDWTASDDRVRGGASQSYLDCHPVSPIATFRGNLDITALGGAGFASQRTTGEDHCWDLSEFDGVELDITKSDSKRYTLILKDELLPKSPNGREQSTVSWEYDFEIAEEDGKKVFVPWDDLKPTYRGREKKDVTPLDLRNVKRISLMMRSFFGDQHGEFKIEVRSIAAVNRTRVGAFEENYRDNPKERLSMDGCNEKLGASRKQGWLSWAFGGCGVL